MFEEARFALQKSDRRGGRGRTVILTKDRVHIDWRGGGGHPRVRAASRRRGEIGKGEGEKGVKMLTCFFHSLAGGQVSFEKTPISVGGGGGGSRT